MYEKTCVFLLGIFCFCNFAVADMYKILVVEGDENTPVIGATVHNLNFLKRGCITNLNGTVEGMCDDNALEGGFVEISYMGYKSQQVHLQQGVLNTIKLETESRQIDEVVVTVTCETFMNSEESRSSARNKYPHATVLSGSMNDSTGCKIEACDNGYKPAFSVQNSKWECVENANISVGLVPLDNKIHHNIKTTPVVVQHDLGNAIAKINDWIRDVSFSKNKWKDVSGNFNTARLTSDLTAGIVLGTVGGVVSGVVIKKKQVEKGFDALSCYVGGQKMADWGDEFRVVFTR